MAEYKFGQHVTLAYGTQATYICLYRKQSDRALVLIEWENDGDESDYRFEYPLMSELTPGWPGETVVEVNGDCPFLSEPCADPWCELVGSVCGGPGSLGCPLRRGPVVVKLKEVE